VAQRVYMRFFGPDPVPFPSYREVERNVKHSLTTLRCACCGSDKHTRNCPKGIEPHCDYEHDGEERLPPHITDFCPVLHNYCAMCQTVGHMERVHLEPKHHRTGRELRERYFKFMATGAYTSLPYLAFHDEGYKKLTGAHWRRAYEGRPYRQAVITRYVLGFTPEIHQRLMDLIKHLPEQRHCDNDRAHQLEAIRENIRKADAGETTPLPREIIAEFQAKRREERAKLKKAKMAENRAAEEAADTSTTTANTATNSAKAKKKK